MDTLHHNGPPAGAIVVGLDLDGSEGALTFAAAEACRTHSPLHLVHVLRISGAEAYAGVVEGCLEAADAAVDQGLARARELVDGQVPVSAERLDDGWLVANLVDRASRGAMLVLEHRSLNQLRRLVTGSTVAGVAARCPVPVVSVPEGWRPGPVEAVVTVGVQDVDEAESLIRRGLVEARARGAHVMVLHAWHIQGGYDSVVADHEFRIEEEHRVALELAPALAAACAEVPDVPVQLRVAHAVPAEALLASGATSQLLVIGRRHHLLPLGSHLGPVARTVLQHSAVPVLLNPESPREVRVAADDDVRVPMAAQLA
jgi:nucleotide-binding universal stress UspA family protein